MPIRSTISRISRRLRRTSPAPDVAVERGSAPRDILDSYVKTAPSPQNALDIFRGEWSSRLPEPLARCRAGAIDLFDDARINWFVEQIGGVRGASVLELGPLEGGHSYLLERLGAAEITSIEANTRAFLKCLITKELLGLERVRVLCGDFLEYLRQPGPTFDVCLASGVLYHLQNPAELVALVSRRCSGHAFFWTHYYDAAIVSASAALAPKFISTSEAEYGGFRHTLYRREDPAAREWAGFCGGGTASTSWMARDDILKCLAHFGFADLRIGFDEPHHQNGPAFGLLGRRR